MLTEFLAKYNISFSEIEALPPDASIKRFYRVHLNNKEQPVYKSYSLKSDSLLVMYYPDATNNLKKFIFVSELLLKNDLLAPKVFEYDQTSNLMLIEDLGNTSINKFLHNKSVEEKTKVYEELIQVLTKMQKIDVFSLDNPDYVNALPWDKMKAKWLNQVLVNFKWYLRYLDKSDNYFDENIMRNHWEKVLDLLPNLPSVFVHGDFHVYNLFTIQKKENNQLNISIIDFQDASLGHPAYDLVSLLSDARIQVDESLQNVILQKYIDLNDSFDSKEIIKSFNILGAQNCTRILGLFAKKYFVDANEKYISYIPTLEGYLKKHLNEMPELKQIDELMQNL